jgi:hypothetical protein
MKPETKRWAWIGGLAAGTAAIVGAIVLWPKKASGNTSQTNVDFGPSPRSFDLGVGGSVVVAIPPGNMSALHVDDFPGLHTVIETGEDAAHFTVNPSTGYGYIKFVAVGKGQAKVVIDTRGQTPAMELNFNVS